MAFSVRKVVFGGERLSSLSFGLGRRAGKTALLKLSKMMVKDDEAGLAAPRARRVDGAQLPASNPRSDLVRGHPEALGDIADSEAKSTRWVRMFNHVRILNSSQYPSP
jgi:hypothetical protein